MEKYKICKRCVMDSTDPHLFIYSNGFCNHCTNWFLRNKILQKQYQDQTFLSNKIEEIKKRSRNSNYDCVIGVSGGTDSTYLAYLAKEKFGLRPLAVHLDNGWNSKLAVKNIQKTIKALDIDLHTHVIDWEEFKALQLAYLKASVIDIEVLSDHAIFASLYNTAQENDIHYVLPGLNPATERIIPKSWTFNKNDLINIMDINSRFGTTKIRTFPTLGRKKLNNYQKQIETFLIFNYIKFNNTIAKKVITEKLGWQDYSGKHFESVFTRFYQGYILPVKFKVDKRRAHLSSLICMGAITREEALEELRKPPYDPELMKQDYNYVVKKLDLTSEEFEEIMNSTVRSHFDFKTNFASKIIKKLMVPTNPVARIISSKLTLAKWGIGTRI